MARRSPDALQKVTINLREGDMDFLQNHYFRIGGGSAVIRHLVSRHVDAVRAAAGATVVPPGAPEPDLSALEPTESAEPTIRASSTFRE